MRPASLRPRPLGARQAALWLGDGGRLFLMFPQLLSSPLGVRDSRSPRSSCVLKSVHGHGSRTGLCGHWGRRGRIRLPCIGCGAEVPILSSCPHAGLACAFPFAESGFPPAPGFPIKRCPSAVIGSFILKESWSICLGKSNLLALELAEMPDRRQAWVQQWGREEMHEGVGVVGSLSRRLEGHCALPCPAPGGWTSQAGGSRVGGQPASLEVVKEPKT